MLVVEATVWIDAMLCAAADSVSLAKLSKRGSGADSAVLSSFFL